MNGTCEWILDHPVYVKWQAIETTDAGAKFFWIHGPAGFGKTVLAAWLVRHINETLKIPVAYHFSSTHAQRSIDSDCIVRSWITQLARSSIDVLHLCQTARRTQCARRASTQDVWNVLREALAHVPSCILALDGLDEFPNVNDARSLFLKDLKNVVTSTKVKVLITSRNEVDIASEINAAASQPPKLSMHECKVSNEIVRGDVHLYSQVAVAKKFPKQSEFFRQDISARMAERSGGMFLWVKLQQCQLRGTQNKKTVERIVEGMPQGLYQTYSRDWNSIQELAEPDRNRAMDIFRWLTFGYRALAVQELAEALVIELDEASEAFCEDDLPADIDDDYSKNEIKALCCSFVDIGVERENSSPRPTLFSTSNIPGPQKKADCPIRCICGLKNADGYLVLCEHCRTWQHNECYYFDDGAMSDVDEIEHHCADCKPLRFNGRGATGHRRMRRKVRQTALRYPKKEVTASEPEMVRLVHISVRDYLVATLPVPTMAKALPTEGSQSAAHHAMLAAYCLRFLDCPQAWSGSDDEDSGYRSFSAYAVHSWFWHLHDAGAYYDSVSGLVHNFMKLGNLNFANWRTRYERDLCINWKEPMRQTNPSAMYYACSFGLLDTMDFLRKRKDEDIDSVGGLFGTALQAACSRGFKGAFDRLMRWGADVTVQGGRYHCAINAAASCGHHYMVQALLDREAQINGPTADNARVSAATETAARQGHTEVVGLLLDYSAVAVPEGRVSHGRSFFLSDLLLEAAAAGYVGIVKLLLDHGADIKACDQNDNTVLHRAAAKNHFELILELLGRGASVRVREERGYTPLHLSAEGGDIGVVACLLTHGADVNAQTESGRTALYIALTQGYLGLAMFLLEHKADANVATAEGWHPIHLAAERGLVDALSMLIERGADQNSQDTAGQSPLHTATACGQRAAVELLLQRGAEISPDSNGTTPLHISTYHAELEITTLLLGSGANPNARVQCGDTPLHMSVRQKDKEADQPRLELVRLLLEQAAVQSPNDSGWTPLHSAVRHGQDDIVALFLDQGCHIDIQTSHGHTPLYVALSNTNIDTADLLLRRGADANIATLSGDTALFPAVRIGNMDLVRSLISKGCDINARNNVGATALRGAIGCASDELIEYMIGQGADMFTIDEYQMACSDWLRRLRPHLLKSQPIAQKLDNGRIGPDIVMLRRRTYELALTIRRDYRKTSVKLACFAKCLLILGMENDARVAYQLETLEPAYCSSVSLCDGCDDDQTRKVPSYHCKSCPDAALCWECMIKHKERPVLSSCHEHKFMRAATSEARIRPHQTEALDEWLCGIEEQLRPADGGEEVDEKLEGLSREAKMCERRRMYAF